MSKVSVVIPNWNGESLLSVCLQSLKEQSWQDFQLIVVDNGSSDDSVQVIKKIFPKADIIQLEKNIGFAPAVNLGIEKAQSEYIFLLNNDTQVDNHCLQQIVKTADQKKDYALFAVKMINFYDHQKIDSAGAYITSVGHANGFGWQQSDGDQYNQAGAVMLVSGGGALIRKEVFTKIGLFDDRYFAYFEDVDLCLRAILAGYQSWYEPKAVVYHVHKATSQKNKPLTEYLQFRNMTMTLIKDFPTTFLLKDLNWLKIILVNLHTVWFLAANGYLKQALQAEWYVLSHLVPLLKDRWQIQHASQINKQRLIAQIVPKKIKLFGVEI